MKNKMLFLTLVILTIFILSQTIYAMNREGEKEKLEIQELEQRLEAQHAQEEEQKRLMQRREQQEVLVRRGIRLSSSRGKGNILSRWFRRGSNDEEMVIASLEKPCFYCPINLKSTDSEPFVIEICERESCRYWVHTDCFYKRIRKSKLPRCKNGSCRQAIPMYIIIKTEAYKLAIDHLRTGKNITFKQWLTIIRSMARSCDAKLEKAKETFGEETAKYLQSLKIFQTLEKNPALLTELIKRMTSDLTREYAKVHGMNEESLIEGRVQIPEQGRFNVHTSDYSDNEGSGSSSNDESSAGSFNNDRLELTRRLERRWESQYEERMPLDVCTITPEELLELHKAKKNQTSIYTKLLYTSLGLGMAGIGAATQYLYNYLAYAEDVTET